MNDQLQVERDTCLEACAEATRAVDELTDDSGANVISVLKAGKSDVFLVGHPGDRPPVVAKRADRCTIENEYRILVLLQSAPVRVLRVYGTVASAEPGRAWLISERAIGEPFDPCSARHREIAGRWMAGIHRWSATAGLSKLPARGVSYLHQVLLDSVTTLQEAHDAITNRDRHDLAPLDGLIAAGHALEARWSAVTRTLDALPPVLVHGGFAGKNIVVQAGTAGPETVLAFDWEQGGWGCAAPDLCMVDLDAYRAAWPGADHGARLEVVAHIGQLLWCFAAIPGERVNLLSRWPDRAMRKLPSYLARCQSAMAELERPSWES